jgi:hypothetical protein
MDPVESFNAVLTGHYVLFNIASISRFRLSVLPEVMPAMAQGRSLLVMRGQAIACCLGIPAECLSGGVYMLSAAEANQVQGPTA